MGTQALLSENKAAKVRLFTLNLDCFLIILSPLKLEFMKSSFVFSLLLILTQLPLLLYSQISVPYKNFEISSGKAQDQNLSEDNQISRTSDNALLRKIDLRIDLPGSTLKEKASSYLNSNWNLFKFTECSDLVLKLETIDIENNIVIFNQIYKNLPVDGNQIILRFDDQSRLISIIQNTIPINRDLKIVPKLTTSTVTSILMKHFGTPIINEQEKSLLMIYHYNNIATLSYFTQFETINPNGKWYAYLDANTGKILELKSNVMNVDGTGRIFNPDPLSASHNKYGNNGITDNNNSNNPVFEPFYTIVNLPGITQNGNVYSLVGDHAKISNPNLYTSNSPFFDFKRHQDGFEAVMCYYFLDKTINYAKGLQSFSNFVYFTPHDIGSNSYYNGSTVTLADGDNGHNEANPDHGEDAMVILHEGFHFIHHSLAGIPPPGKSYLSLGAEGVAEGVADYWALSEVNSENQFKDYEDGFYGIFRWANHNPGTVPSGMYPSTDRFANSTLMNITYVSPFMNCNCGPHYFGTVLSGVLLKIYNDIGKEKTDRMVLRGLANIKYGYTAQPHVATAMFDATGPNGLNYNDWERCIIWSHFNKTYNIPANNGDKFLPLSFSGNGLDLYMKDNLEDLGVEINPTNKDMWLSEDIWVRPTNDNFYYHDNPVYRKNSTTKENYIKVRVRGRGCNVTTNALLKVYWSKASTGLKWPSNWEYSVDPISGKQISGLVGTVNLGALGIESGEEAIVTLAWIPPNPDDFNDSDKHHYCLLARIESTEDPMYCTEVSNINENVKCNNNIIWKNVTIFSTTGFTKDTAILYIRDILQTITPSPSCIEIKDAILPHFHPTLANASISVNLREPLKSIWIAGGMQGSGFTLDPETGLFNITSFPAIFCNLTLIPDYSYLMDIYSTGNGNPKPYVFDLRHYKMTAPQQIIGGERFIYPGTGNDALPRNSLKEKDKQLVEIFVNPNPCSEETTIQFNTVVSQFEYAIYDLNSNLLFSSHVNSNNNSAFKLNLSKLDYKGVIIINIKNKEFNKTFKILKL